jgi:hypothetical protein
MRTRTREEIMEAAKRLRRLTPEEISNYELPPIPSEEEVKGRIADYQKRVDELFTRIQNWVADDGRYHASRSGVDYIFERYIAYYDMIDAEVPLLSIYAPDEAEVLRFRPNGIWVVPTNGRIAIETPNVPPKRRLHNLRLLDQAQEIGKSDWTLWGASRDQFGTDAPFNQGSLLKLIREQHDAAG